MRAALAAGLIGLAAVADAAEQAPPAPSSVRFNPGVVRPPVNTDRGMCIAPRCDLHLTTTVAHHSVDKGGTVAIPKASSYTEPVAHCLPLHSLKSVGRGQ